MNMIFDQSSPVLLIEFENYDNYRCWLEGFGLLRQSINLAAINLVLANNTDMWIAAYRQLWSDQDSYG